MTRSIYFAPYQVPLVEPSTGLMSKPWFMFFQALFARVGGAAGASNDDLEAFAAEDLDSGGTEVVALGAQIQELKGVSVDADLGEAPSRQDVADALILAHAALDTSDPIPPAITVSIATGSGLTGGPLAASGSTVALNAASIANLALAGTALQPIGALAGSYTYASLTLNSSGQITAVATGAAPAVSANPTATVGLAAVNGVATTYLRSDGAPALNVGIVPTWTGSHTFSALVTANLGLTVAGAAFTSRGISDASTATAMTIAAAGNISIGTATVIGQGLQCTGSGTTGFAGAGTELYNAGGVGGIQAYNRTSAAYLPMSVIGSTLSLNIGGTPALAVAPTGKITIAGNVGVNGAAPPAQVTGWGTPTGPAVVANFSGTAATNAQLLLAVAKIITDLKALGLYGT